MSIDKLFWELRNYKPEKRIKDALQFNKIARYYPDARSRSDKKLPKVAMSKLANLGYCPYKAWHYGNGTQEFVPYLVREKRDRGTKIHGRITRKDQDTAKRAPPAGPKEFRDPKINLLPVIEFRSQVKVEKIIYSSRIERASREKKRLIVTEIKSGHARLTPSHYIQVWGYCLSAPGSLSFAINEYTAEEILWRLSYPDLDKQYGPYPFTENNFRLLRESMKRFQILYFLGLSNNTLTVPQELPGPSINKCAACGYYKSCSWKQKNPGWRDRLYNAGI